MDIELYVDVNDPNFESITGINPHYIQRVTLEDNTCLYDIFPADDIKLRNIRKKIFLTNKQRL